MQSRPAAVGRVLALTPGGDSPMRLRLSIACLALLGLAAAGGADDKEKDKGKDTPKDAAKATIKVLVPGGNAQVTLKIEGNETKQTGEERVFETPARGRAKATRTRSRTSTARTTY